MKEAREREKKASETKERRGRSERSDPMVQLSLIDLCNSARRVFIARPMLST